MSVINEDRTAAAAWRDELLARGWPTSVDVGRSNGSKAASNPGQWAKDQRDAGALLGVWDAARCIFLHPGFQFDVHGLLVPKVKDLLTALATVPEFMPANDRGGWRRAFWMYGTVPALADPESGKPRVPAEVFKTDPGAVIQVARKDREGDLDGRW